MKYFLILLSTISFGQQSIKVLYESKVSISPLIAAQFPEASREELIKLLTKTIVMELINNGEVSVVKNEPDKDIIIQSNITSTATNVDKGNTLKLNKIWIFKDFITNSCFTSYTINDIEYYLKEEPKEKNKLIFDKKTMMIDGYNCKSAMELTTENDTIQYWYTQDIPIFDGPKQMTNIPGLILRYQLKSQTITATKIEFFDKKLLIEGLNKKIQVITLDEYYKLQAEFTKSTFSDDGKGTKISTETKTIKL